MKLLAALMALTLVAAACGDDEEGATSSDTATASGGATDSDDGGFLPADLQGDAPDSLKIGLTGAYALNFLPVIVAEGAGYFDEIDERFGTDISFQTYGGGTDGQAAFNGGEVPMLVIAPASYTGAVLQGQDQIAIFNQELGLGIVASAAKKREAEWGTDIEKFADAKWCQIGPVGTSNTAAKLLSAQAGLDPGGIEIFSTGSVAAVVPSLQSGQCDIVTGDINSAARGIAEDVLYVAANPWVPCDTIPLMGEQVGIPLTTSRKFTEQYPEFTSAIVAATLKGLQFVQENRDDPEAIYENLPPEMTSEFPLELFKIGMEIGADAFDPITNDGRFTEQAMNDTLWNLRAVELIPRDSQPDPSKVFTNEFVNDAYDLLGVEPLAAAQEAPEQSPTTLGQPSEEAAKAWATLTGQAAPEDTGPSKVGQEAC